MSFFDKKTTFDTVRLGIFVVVTTIATALLAVTIGNISFNPTTKYRAVFTDSVVAPEMGLSPSDVPDLTTLMVGPLLRGGQVNLK